MTIGIGGISRSGKSTLAALIQRYFTERGQTCLLLAQDDYVFPREQIPTIQKGEAMETDWEIPESIDFQRYKTAILTAQKGYDHVITEGFLNFYDPTINALFDKFLFVSLSKPTFLSRKAADKRWGNVPDWYIEHIWTSYQRYGQTALTDKQTEVLVLSGETDFDVSAIIDFLKKSRN